MVKKLTNTRIHNKHLTNTILKKNEEKIMSILIIIEIILILLGIYSIYKNFNNPEKRKIIYIEILLIIMIGILLITHLL